ncbi:nucleotide-binding protein [Corynebacterium mastitidis]|uniref:Nucleotide-binding protein n=1 Tax=Corynebacterium mastitidis TaxID=161890 RepID=A0ABU8P0G1_9CORY
MLKFLVGDAPAVMPESVEREMLFQQASDPRLEQITRAGWIGVDRCNDLGFLRDFARYEQRLVPTGSERNRGECGVLALARARGWMAVLDDAAPRTIAEEEGIGKTGTLGLLCRAIREERLTVPMVERLTDDLIEGCYYLPFGPGSSTPGPGSGGLSEPLVVRATRGPGGTAPRARWP